MGKTRNKVQKAQQGGYKKGKNKNDKQKKVISSGTTGGSGTPDDTTGAPENFDEPKQPKKTPQPTQPVGPEKNNNDYNKNGADSGEADSGKMDVDTPEENNEITVESANREKIDVHTAATSMSQANPPQETTDTTPHDGGEIKGIPDPLDEEKQDDEKFDIQQGDFIDFLMKEVVLASAAWLGKRTSNIINVALYRVSSEIYHKTKDGIVDGYEYLKEENKKRKEHLNHVRTCAKQGKINDDIIKETRDAGNEETAKIYELHNAEIKNAIDKTYSGELCSKFIEELMKNPNDNFFQNCSTENDGKIYWKDDTGKKLLIKSNSPDGPAFHQYAEEMIKLRTMIDSGGLSDNQKRDLGITQEPVSEEDKNRIFQALCEPLSIALQEAAAIDADATFFAASMSTAQMLKDGAVSADRDAYVNFYKAQFYSLAKKLRQGQQLDGIKNTKKLSEISKDAVNLCVEQNEKENGLNEDNKYLIKINNIISSNNIDDNTHITTLQQEAVSSSKKIQKLSQQEQNYTDSLNLASHSQTTYGDEKRRLQATRQRCTQQPRRDNASEREAQATQRRAQTDTVREQFSR